MSVAVPIEALLGPRMTTSEWAELSEDVPGELVDGRLVEEEVPDYAHEVIVAWLIVAATYRSRRLYMAATLLALATLTRADALVLAAVAGALVYFRYLPLDFRIVYADNSVCLDIIGC